MISAGARPDLPPGALRAAVRNLLRDPAAEPGPWEAVPLDEGASGRSCHLISGSAGGRPWRLVVKVFAPAPGQDDPRDPGYFRREPLLHASGLLGGGGGLRGPRCHGRDEPTPGAERLWMEFVEDDGPWGPPRWALAARHLGRWNAAHPARAGTPAWLGGGRLRAVLGRSEPLVARIAAARDDPRVRGFWPEPVVAALLRLWEERERFCAALERLPQFLGHGDAIRRNLRGGADGETIAIDWEFAGSYAPGEEVGQTLSVAAAFFEAEPGDLPELDAALSAAYLAGLAEGGWRGEPRAVRFALAAHCALRNAFNAVGATAPSAAGRDPALRRYGRPWEALAERRAAIRPFLLARAEEARGLLPRA